VDLRGVSIFRHGTVLVPVFCFVHIVEYKIVPRNSQCSLIYLFEQGHVNVSIFMLII
jgi:hypothetical protein